MSQESQHSLSRILRPWLCSRSDRPRRWSRRRCAGSFWSERRPRPSLFPGDVARMVPISRCTVNTYTASPIRLRSIADTILCSLLGTWKTLLSRTRQQSLGTKLGRHIIAPSPAAAYFVSTTARKQGKHRAVFAELGGQMLETDGRVQISLLRFLSDIRLASKP
jgi:hypothetical protein